MNDILKTYMERFRENRHTLRRYTAFVLALAMITTLFVNWQLHGVGISMTAQYQCGEEEHTHTADCYTKVLTCGYEEGELENADEVAAAAATSQPTVEAEPAPLALEPQIEFVPHEHTEDCYTEVQTLTCMEEEHVHGDDCFDPEDGSLICDKFEHTHDESCYTHRVRADLWTGRGRACGAGGGAHPERRAGGYGCGRACGTGADGGHRGAHLPPPH